jgi:hypothetical protein
MRRLLLLAALLVAAPAFAQQTYASGLSVTLPEGWEGPTEVDESGLPGRASYRFENRSETSPLIGTVLHVERVTGLNPVMRERWIQGRVPYGYHGARPIAPLSSSPWPGAVGFRTEREDFLGDVYFLVQGSVYWAVQIEAPATVFLANEETLRSLLRGLQITAASNAGG